MWIVLNNSFVSVVQHREDPALVLVRGRFRGDVDRFLNAKREIETPGADYRFRATVTRRELADGSGCARHRGGALSG